MICALLAVGGTCRRKTGLGKWNASFSTFDPSPEGNEITSGDWKSGCCGPDSLQQGNPKISQPPFPPQSTADRNAKAGLKIPYPRQAASRGLQSTVVVRHRGPPRPSLRAPQLRCVAVARIQVGSPGQVLQSRHIAQMGSSHA